MYQFPKDLYADVRIEETYNLWLSVQNGDLDSDGSTKQTGAFIRVFDGTMWYTGTTNDLDEIQKELDNLATLATPNPGILTHPMVKMLEVHKENVIRFDGEDDIRKVTRTQWKELLDGKSVAANEASFIKIFDDFFAETMKVFPVKSVPCALWNIFKH